MPRSSRSKIFIFAENKTNLRQRFNFLKPIPQQFSRRTLKFERKPKSKPIYHNPRDIEIWTYRFLDSYSSNLSIPPDGCGQWHTERRKEGRKVLSRRFVNKKVTFPTGGGYSPFIFRLISIQDGKKFGAPLLRRSSSKLEEGVHGDCAASPRHHPFHYAEINLGSLFSYQSRITPKPHHRYVPSHRSSLYPSRRGKAEECRVELSLEGNGVKGGERGRLSKVGNACLEKRWAYWPVCRGESVSARKLCWEKHQF